MQRLDEAVDNADLLLAEQRVAGDRDSLQKAELLHRRTADAMQVPTEGTLTLLSETAEPSTLPSPRRHSPVSVRSPRSSVWRSVCSC